VKSAARQEIKSLTCPWLFLSGGLPFTCSKQSVLVPPSSCSDHYPRTLLMALDFFWSLVYRKGGGASNPLSGFKTYTVAPSRRCGGSALSASWISKSRGNGSIWFVPLAVPLFRTLAVGESGRGQDYRSSQNLRHLNSFKFQLPYRISNHFCRH
jgi:hypothetical protein